MLLVFLKALGVGFAIAAPVGPIGLLCIRRTLADGRLVGLATGLGAATADAVYGLVAGLGLGAASAALLGQAHWVRFVGCAWLAWLGIRTLLARPAEKPAEPKAGTHLGAWGSTFFLTLTNPLSILSFAAVFSAFALSLEIPVWVRAPLFAGGVFSGSALWWLILSGGVSLLRPRPVHLLWVNRSTGVLLVGFAAALAF